MLAVASHKSASSASILKLLSPAKYCFKVCLNVGEKPKQNMVDTSGQDAQSREGEVCVGGGVVEHFQPMHTASGKFKGPEIMESSPEMRRASGNFRGPGNVARPKPTLSARDHDEHHILWSYYRAFNACILGFWALIHFDLDITWVCFLFLFCANLKCNLGFSWPSVSVSLSRCFSRSDHLALHMKRHIWGRKGGAGERKEQEERGGGGGGGEIGRESEGWADELWSAHLIHPVYKPVGGHDACRAAHPYERVIISNTLAALSVETGTGGQWGVARLLFFYYTLTHLQ